MERWVSLQDVNELVLLRVSVAQRRHRAGCKLRQVYSEVCETKQVTQWLFSPSRHPRRKRLGIVRRLCSSRCFICADGNMICRICHAILLFKFLSRLTY